MMDLWSDWQIEIGQEERQKLEDLFQKAGEGALSHEGVDRQVEVSLTIVPEETIHELNKKYRGVDSVTDVLSFPLLDFHGETPKERVRRAFAEGDIDYDSTAVALGDVVICYQRALDQAQEYGHSRERELAFLMVHSMLHLLGYDHMTKEEESVMFDHQERIMEEIGLPR